MISFSPTLCERVHETAYERREGGLAGNEQGTPLQQAANKYVPRLLRIDRHICIYISLKANRVCYAGPAQGAVAYEVILVGRVQGACGSGWLQAGAGTFRSP